MLKRIIKNNKYTLISIFATIILFAIWELVAVIIGKDYLLPRFSIVLKEFFALFGKKDFYTVTANTLLRSLLGFVIAFFIGAILGIICGKNKVVKSIVSPIISALRTTPTMALTLILMVWFRSSLTPMLIGVIMVLPIICQTLSDSILTVDKKLLEMAQIYEFSKKKIITYIYIPHITPMLFSSAITAFGLNIKAVVSAEILAFTANSIGLKMYIAKSDIFEGTATLFAWVLIALLLSVFFEIIMTLIQRRICRKWK